MTQERFERALEATSDNAGGIVFDFQRNPPTATNKTIYATLAVPDAGDAGNFVATLLDGQTLGIWSSGQPASVGAWRGDLPVTVTGSGLLPNTQYVLWARGFVSENPDLTWVVQTPTGTTSLFGQDAITQSVAMALAAGATVWPGGANNGTGQAFFPCINFAALRLSIENVLTGGPITVECLWFNQDQTARMGYRRYVLGSDNGNIGELVVPHLGDMLSIKVTNQTAASDAVFNLTATHTTQPIAQWGGGDINNANGFGVGAGATITALAPVYIFGGPADLEFNPGGFAAAYVMSLEAQEPDGTWNPFLVRTNTDPGVKQSLEFFCPAQPIRLRVTNNTGDLHSADAALLYDLHRVG